MIVTYTGGTGQQRSWFETAIAQMQYPWDSLTALNVQVSWPVEPSLPGHKEYACTTQLADYNHFSLEIRRELDTIVRFPPVAGEGRPANIQNFYMECVAHEMSHVLWFHLVDAPTIPVTLAEICGWFERQVSGDGPVAGTPADLHPVGALWEDMLQEGIAETLKDALLPEGYRDYDNRTNWHLKEDHYHDFMGLFINQIEGGPGTERVCLFHDTANPANPGPIPVTETGLTYIPNETGIHLQQKHGYPRVRYLGSHLGSPVGGIVDYPDFWTPGHPPGHHDGQLLDVTHQQNAAIDDVYDDTGVFVGPAAYVIDPEGPVVGGNPYVSVLWAWGIYNYAGYVQVSQFLPDPVGNIPPWPYKDPQLQAAAQLQAAVRFKTR